MFLWFNQSTINFFNTMCISTSLQNQSDTGNVTSFVPYIKVAWKIILRTRRIYIQSYIPNKLLDNWRLFVFTPLFPNNMDLKVANILLKNLFVLDVNSKFYKWLEIFLTRRIQCQIRGTTRITPWTDIILYMVFIRR